MSRQAIAAVFAALVASTITATALAGAQAPRAAAQRPACTNVALGFLGPLTGSARSLAREQLSWLRFGAQRFNRANGTQFDVVVGDTRRKAAVVRTQTRKLIGNASVLATVVGGADSQAVRMSGKLLAGAKLVSISGAATAVELTKGHPYKTFFRLVPNDGVQGPDVVDFVSGRLGAKHVVVIDSQDEDSMQQAATIALGLRDRGVTVERDGVSPDETDFTSAVAAIDAKVDIVVFATRAAAAANTLSNQLREQAKKAVVFGTGGAYSPSQFKPRSGYVSVFAPDLRFDPKSKALLREYRTFAKRDSGGPFGPATYMAGWVAMAAIQKACKNGAVTRSEVVDHVEGASVRSIIGPRVRFDRNGDLRGGGSFAIYRITDGKYAPVAP